MGMDNMAYRVAGSSGSDIKCPSYTIFVLNFIIALLGATMVSLGFWITLDPEFKQWVQDLGMQHFWVGVYILMAAGAIVVAQAFFGICGVYQRQPNLLWMYIGLSVLCICLEIGGAAYTLANGTRGSHIEDWLNDRFYYYISVYDQDESAARILNIIQEWVGCCGAQGALDYTSWKKLIPYTCYNPITGNAWYMKDYGYMGCVRGFTMYLETRAGWISGVALALCFFQLWAILFAYLLIKVITDFRKSTEYLDRR